MWSFLKKLKIELPCEPSLFFPDVYIAPVFFVFFFKPNVSV